jgi:hypothetical protein
VYGGSNIIKIYDLGIYDGRALAIVRPTGAGELTVTVMAEGLEQATVVIRASAAI